MTRAIDLLVVSPHMDDAVMSCGGLLHRRHSRGDTSRVVTVCAGYPPPGASSPYAREHHSRWVPSGGLADDHETARAMVDRRREEDALALQIVCSEGHYLDVPDAIHRPAPDGGWLYENEAALFGRLDPREGDLVDRVAAELADLPAIGPRTLVLVPLGVGGHVDHRLSRAAAEGWLLAMPADVRPPMRYYEDFPYARDRTAVDELEAREAASGVMHAPEFPRLLPADIDAKIDAIAAHSSQISTFWPNEIVMGEEVRAWAHSAALDAGFKAESYAERLWMPTAEVER